MKYAGLILLGAAVALQACGSKPPTAAADVAAAATAVAKPFDADSAYAYAARQLSFGPRVPGTASHARCAAWIADELRRHGADSVMVQRGEAFAPDGRRVAVTNILGRFDGASPQARRLLLAAHYDTRPQADAETDPARASQPVPGANDGASGVAVLLETARQLGLERAERGVDLLFVDAEDGGNDDDPLSWGLGSQYWAAHMPYADTADDPRPVAGILLDMVGGAGARFHREFYSDDLAPDVVDLVWSTARQAGHASRFVDAPGGAVVDDHLFLNRAGIPTIDIIESCNDATGSFPPHWHTLDDDLSALDTSTLRAAGETVAAVIRRPATNNRAQ